MKGATKYQLIASLAPLLSLLLLNASCGNSLFKVKPASALPPLSGSAASANVGVITFRAAPLLTDEETQKLFESNLQLAGLLPIRLEVIHNGGDPIEIKRLKFQLRDASNSDWKLISAEAAISLILKAIPPAPGDSEAPLQILVNNLDHDEYTGRLAIGRVVADPTFRRAARRVAAAIAHEDPVRTAVEEIESAICPV